jgi:hypothetical protein
VRSDDRFLRNLRFLVGAVAFGTSVLVLVVVIIEVTANGVDALWLLSWLGFVVVGGFLVIRQPHNRMSWVLFGLGFSVSIGAMSELAAEFLPPPALAIVNNMAMVGFLLLPLLLLWYPTGRPPSIRWIWLERTIVILGSTSAVYYLLRPGEIGVTEVPNPLGLAFLTPLRDSWVEESAGSAIVLAGVLAFVSLVVRWRRGAGPERQQIKFVVLAGLLFVGLVIVGMTLGEQGIWGVAPFVLGLNAIAVAVAVAVVKYHLYDIDRIISRTLTYAVVIGLLGAFFLLVASLPSLLIGGASEGGERATSPPVLVAASTLAAAALFNPLRKRVTRTVDRRFNRSPYNAESVLEEFGSLIDSETQMSQLAGHWTRAVVATMHPSSIGVWIGGDQPRSDRSGP